MVGRLVGWLVGWLVGRQQSGHLVLMTSPIEAESKINTDLLEQVDVRRVTVGNFQKLLLQIAEQRFSPGLPDLRFNYVLKERARAPSCSEW